jgi:hypothetical protein
MQDAVRTPLVGNEGVTAEPCGPPVERETPDIAEMGKLGSVRNRPDQGVEWS